MKNTRSHHRPALEASRGRMRGAVALLCLLWIMAACGYQQDRPALPAAAHSLGVGPVINLTGTGELDVRLRALLLEKFATHAHIRLGGPSNSDLELRVTLNSFQITRALDTVIGTDRAFGFSLAGSLKLIDNRSGKTLIASHPFQAGLTRYYAPSVLETPAIRDEGMQDVLKTAAEQVVNRVLLVF